MVRLLGYLNHTNCGAACVPILISYDIRFICSEGRASESPRTALTKDITSVVFRVPLCTNNIILLYYCCTATLIHVPRSGNCQRQAVLQDVSLPGTTLDEKKKAC